MKILLPCVLLLTGCCYAPPDLGLTEREKRALPHLRMPPLQPPVLLYQPRPTPIWGADD